MFNGIDIAGQELDGALVDIQPFMAEHVPLIGSRVTKVLRCPENEDGDEDDHEDEDGWTELGTPPSRCRG